MKKFTAFIITLSMMIMLLSCGKDVGIKVGRIDDGFNHAAMVEHFGEDHIGAVPIEYDEQVYINLSAAMLALKKGEISSLSTNRTVADYIIAQNDGLMLYEPTWFKQNDMPHRFAMLTSSKNSALHYILDSAIKELSENGILDRLIVEELRACIESDPTPIELPYFKDGETYKIAVTGDLPPMDFVTADGRAAGFNVALLTEISKIAEVNFEIVVVDTAARMTALSTGVVDALFWMTTYGCQLCDETITAAPKGTLATEIYFADYVAFVKLR